METEEADTREEREMKTMTELRQGGHRDGRGTVGQGQMGVERVWADIKAVGRSLS